MNDEVKKKAGTLNPTTMKLVVGFMLFTLIAFSAVFSMVSPLDPWMTYAVICMVWLGDSIAISILYSSVRQHSGQSSHGLVKSGFGEQRPDIGTMKKRG